MKRLKKPLDPAELVAILDLLEDRDADVVFSLAKNIKSMEEDQLGALLEAWHQRGGQGIPPAFEIAQRLRAVEKFCVLVSRPDHPPELESGAFLISSWGRPDLSLRRAQLKLDAYASHLSETISRKSARENPMEAARALCRYLFDEIGFRGNEENYTDPDNSFLAAVIELRRGIPISLCVMALLVAKRMFLELVPIGSPNRFLLAVRDGEHLRYIDCFGGGLFLDAAQARQRLGDFPEGVEPFPQVGTHEILARMLRNLYANYRQIRDELRVAEIERMLTAASI